VIIKSKSKIEKIRDEAIEEISWYEPWNIIPKGPKEKKDICETCLYLFERLRGCQVGVFNKDE